MTQLLLDTIAAVLLGMQAGTAAVLIARPLLDRLAERLDRRSAP